MKHRLTVEQGSHTLLLPWHPGTLQASKRDPAKQMFSKDELAAILRFGAEELFKSSGGAGNPGGCSESSSGWLDCFCMPVAARGVKAIAGV
jgi:hypothetical protein